MESHPEPTEVVSPRPAVMSSAENDRTEIQSLQFTVNVLVVSVLIATLGVNLYMWRQLRTVRRQIEENQKVISEYQRTVAPLIKDMVGRFHGFASSNRDFAPIINKYAPAGTNFPAGGPTNPVRK